MVPDIYIYIYIYTHIIVQVRVQYGCMNIAQVAQMYFHEPKVSENAAHECNVM